MLARFEQQPHPGLQLFHRHGALVAVFIHQSRLLRRGLEKRPNFALGPAHCVMFERAGKGEQEEQHRAFAPGADAGAAEGDHEHEEMHVQRALPEQLMDFVDGEPAPGDVGNKVEHPGWQTWAEEIRGQPGQAA